MDLHTLSFYRFAFSSSFYLLVIMIPWVQSDGSQMYFNLEPFRVVHGPVLETLTALDSFECLIWCMKNKKCVSVNFAVHSGIDKRFFCQLLTTDCSGNEKRQVLYSSAVYHHYYKNPCAANRCKNSGVCDVTNDVNCTCPTPYRGTLCDQVSWTKVNKEPMCFGAKNDSFGTILMTSPGRVESIKLVHLHGTVTCQKDDPSRSTYWGCYSPTTNISKITTIITDKYNKKFLPTASNNLQGFHGNATAIVFSTESLSVFNDVTAGQEFRVWYYEDFANDGMEDDNDGLSCADVFILYRP